MLHRISDYRAKGLPKPPLACGGLGGHTCSLTGAEGHTVNVGSGNAIETVAGDHISISFSESAPAGAPIAIAPLSLAYSAYGIAISENQAAVIGGIAIVSSTLNLNPTTAYGQWTVKPRNRARGGPNSILIVEFMSYFQAGPGSVVVIKHLEGLNGNIALQAGIHFKPDTWYFVEATNDPDFPARSGIDFPVPNGPFLLRETQEWF